MKEMAIEQYMSKYPYITNSLMSVHEAYKLMREKNIRHLPVVEDNRLVGVVTDRDVRHVIGTKDSNVAMVCQVMSSNPYFVRRGESILAVVRKMIKDKYGCAIVMDQNEWISGIFTTVDALVLLEKLLDDDGQPKQLSFEAIENHSFPYYDAVAI